MVTGQKLRGPGRATKRGLLSQGWGGKSTQGRQGRLGAAPKVRH